MGKHKSEKKALKAKIKMAKVESKARLSDTQGSTRLPEGVGMAVSKTGDGAQLIIHGLTEAQLTRILPQINKEILISVTQDKPLHGVNLPYLL